MDPVAPFGAGQIARWIRAAPAALKRRVRADHATIAQRHLRVTSHMLRHYLYATVAPSRWSARPADDTTVSRAQAFAETALPGVFDPDPEYADRELVLFARTSADDHVREHTLVVQPTGLVELLWALPVHATDADTLVLPATEIVRPVGALAAAVATANYAALSKVGRGRRRFGRVDWWFTVVTDVPGDNGSLTWNSLAFPGPAPPRARHTRAMSPLHGYGGSSLRSRPRSSDPDEIARTLLTELLAANGYHSYASAVDDTLAAAAAYTSPLIPDKLTPRIDARS